MSTKGWKAREAAAIERNQHLSVDEDIRAQRAAVLAKIREESGRGYEVEPATVADAATVDPAGVSLMTSAKKEIQRRKGKASEEDPEGALIEE